jgi:hypothetical protein
VTAARTCPRLWRVSWPPPTALTGQRRARRNCRASPPSDFLGVLGAGQHGCHDRADGAKYPQPAAPAGLIMHIEILKHAPSGYEVRVVDPEGQTVRSFTRPSWSLAYQPRRRRAALSACPRPRRGRCSSLVRANAPVCPKTPRVQREQNERDFSTTVQCRGDNGRQGIYQLLRDDARWQAREIYRTLTQVLPRTTLVYYF